MRTTRWITIIASALSFVATSGCARNAILADDDLAEGEARVIRPLDVVVTNYNFSDVKVYALAETGASLWLGTVTGLSSATFKLHRAMFPGGILRLVATPISGYGVAESGMLRVTNAHEAGFTVQSNIASSFGLVR